MSSERFEKSSVSRILEQCKYFNEIHASTSKRAPFEILEHSEKTWGTTQYSYYKKHSEKCLELQFGYSL